MPKIQSSLDYDTKKFKELLVYVAKKSEKDPRFGAGKLNKLMFFIEFFAYAELGKPLTGAPYWKIDRGPVPHDLLIFKEEMTGVDIRIESVPLGGPYKNQERWIALREPDTNVFPPDERAIIDSVIERFWEMNGAEIAAESYKEPGVELAHQRETIPLRSVFMDLSPWSDDDTAEAHRRLKHRGWAA